MLVIISDLHFVDGTAGEHDVPVDAFHIFFENLKSATERLKKKEKRGTRGQNCIPLRVF
jgi:hypothetical protein